MPHVEITSVYICDCKFLLSITGSNKLRELYCGLGNDVADNALCAQCPLYMAPALDQYPWVTQGPHSLGIPGKMQALNASLALQLCNIWLRDHIKSVYNADVPLDLIHVKDLVKILVHC